jgi:hypothetical protein
MPRERDIERIVAHPPLDSLPAEQGPIKVALDWSSHCVEAPAVRKSAVLRLFGLAPEIEFVEPDQGDSTCPVLIEKIF